MSMSSGLDRGFEVFAGIVAQNPWTPIKHVLYHIIQCYIVSCHIIPNHIISYHIISNHITSYHTIPNLIESYHLILHHSRYVILYHIDPSPCCPGVQEQGYGVSTGIPSLVSDLHECGCLSKLGSLFGSLL